MNKATTNKVVVCVAKRAKLVDTFEPNNSDIVEYRFDLRQVWGDYVIVAVPEGLASEEAARLALYNLLVA